MSRREVMNQQSIRSGVQLMALGWSLSLFFLLTFVLRAALVYLLPADTAHLLARVMPSLDWRDPSNIAFGAVAAFASGWYAAFFGGGLYNYFRGGR